MPQLWWRLLAEEATMVDLVAYRDDDSVGGDEDGGVAKMVRVAAGGGDEMVNMEVVHRRGCGGGETTMVLCLCSGSGVAAAGKKAKWDNDDYVCRGLILNGMSDSLFDIYQNVKSSKELWDSLEAKYMAENVSSKKFFVNNFTNYKMTDSRLVLKQYNELLGKLGRLTQHKMNMDEAIQVSCIIDKLPHSWKDFKHILKHLKEELMLVELGSHLRIKKSLRMQDSDKPKGNNDAGPSVVNMVEHNNSSMYNDNKG
uniref:Zinc finger, CCHC-type n=1 Tax=Tanacetum cinerariifolium TaxID=118510 RepID=A0A699HME1_TANCI|nr:zinc finger, CCHC-type [Tanacetum cinerariifolium]